VEKFSSDQLEQMVAPLALYRTALTDPHVLPFPIQIVRRAVEKNPA
jgi:hypothetical protein